MRKIFWFLIILMWILAFAIFFSPFTGWHYAHYARADTLEEIVKEQADKYDVSSKLMFSIMKCESGMNPLAINDTSKEYSVGLVQINLKVHTNITEIQAKDPYFASSFLAENLAKGNGRMWYTCYKRALANLETPSKS